MANRQIVRAAVRQILEEAKKRAERGEDHRWMQGTDDTLMLTDPGMMVEPDVRQQISQYLKKMGLMK